MAHCLFRISDCQVNIGSSLKAVNRESPESTKPAQAPVRNCSTKHRTFLGLRGDSKNEAAFTRAHEQKSASAKDSVIILQKLVATMSGSPATEPFKLEVISPDLSRRTVQIHESPFLIGRGSETGNHLQLSDPRISRNCAAIVTRGEGCYLEDRGHRGGIFVNGKKSTTRRFKIWTSLRSASMIRIR